MTSNTMMDYILHTVSERAEFVEGALLLQQYPTSSRGK